MSAVTEYPTWADRIDEEMPLASCDPDGILDELDLTGLAAAKADDRLGALAALRDHYRAKYPLAEVSGAVDLETADKYLSARYPMGAV